MIHDRLAGNRLDTELWRVEPPRETGPSAERIEREGLACRRMMAIMRFLGIV